MNIENLVFSGGGVKGYAYVGVIKCLEENDILSNIKNIAGTSIGSIFSLLLCLKYSYSEIEKLSLNIDLDTINNIDSENIINFLSFFGIDNGEKIERVIKILVKAKLNKTDITFKELYEYSKINLYINSTRVNDRNNIIYSHITNPDFSVIKAIRMSISIPFFYIPVKENNNYFIDGAVSNNFLIELFKNDINKTLGFLITECFRSSEIIDFYEYFENIFYSLIDYDYEELNKFHFIKIESNINLLNFNINADEKNILIDLGYNKTKDYINNFKIIDTINTKNIQTQTVTYKNVFTQTD